MKQRRELILFPIMLAALVVLTSCSPYGRATAGVTSRGPYYRGVPGGSDIGGQGYPTFDYSLPRGARR